MLFAATLLLVLLQFGCQPISFLPARVVVPDAGTEVPGTIQANLMHVEVMINGQGPFLFVVDTGAASSVVSSAVASRWPNATIGSTPTFVPAFGTQTSPVVRLDVIELGGARFEGVNAAVIDVPSVFGGGRTLDGILGLPLFETMLLTFDYPGTKLRLAKGSLPPADGCTIVNTGRVGDPTKITIRTTISGREHDVILDTGFSKFLLLPAEFKDLPFIAPPVTSPDGTVIFTGCLAGTSVSFGCQSYREVCLSVEGSLALLGGGALQSFRMTVDRASDRVQVEL